MKAIIVGGGIGGLTTALMLRARGIECDNPVAGRINSAGYPVTRLSKAGGARRNNGRCGGRLLHAA